LTPEHIKNIFDYKVEKIGSNITLSFNINEEKFNNLIGVGKGFPSPPSEPC
jgi:hypothetical protein